jgi:hypothetical protein
VFKAYRAYKVFKAYRVFKVFKVLDLDGKALGILLEHME